MNRRVSYAHATSRAGILRAARRLLATEIGMVRGLLGVCKCQEGETITGTVPRAEIFDSEQSNASIVIWHVT
jgi:hypothetical protein